MEFVQLRSHRRDDLREVGFQFPLDWGRGLAFFKSRNRINRCTILRHHEMKMWTCCESSLPDKADKLTLFQGLSGANSRRDVG